MENLITTRSKDSLEGMKVFWYSQPQPIVYLFVEILFIGFNLVLSALTFILWTMTGEGLSFALVFAALLAFSVFNLVRLLKIPEKLLKHSRSKCEDAVEELSFGTDKITVNITGTGLSEHSELPYPKVYRAVCRKGYFMIFWNRSAAYIFSSRDITSGTHKELASLLHDKLGSRFREAK
ncbi:MAG: YcxB family protein [Ruminococcus sp.]|nr:YcxB family protein [Ruminococcus sp.]